MNPAIRVEQVAKQYRRLAPGHRLRTLKSAFVGRSLASDAAAADRIPALDDVSFTVERGESFGIVGGNGSGKSTLLKLIAGILRPDAGRVVTDGRVAALIELGAGFHPEISGRENVYINGSVLGLTRRQIDQRFDRIVEFSGLADFIDEPVKNYSSGMYVRLGFAVAIHTDPDILLVDEVLAVGDEAFSHQCLRRIEELLASGRTVVFVSHSLALVEDVCSRVLWLDRGKVRLIGEPRRVVDAYRAAVAEAEGRAHRAVKEERERAEAATEAAADRPDAVDADVEAGGEPAEPEEVLRWGSRAAEIVTVRLLDAAGEERYHLRSGELLTFEISARAHSPQTDFVFGIAIKTPRDVDVWGTNTDLEGFRAERFDGDATVRVVCPALRLAPGEYLVDVAVHARDGAPYDYRRRFAAFSVTAEERGVGVYFPEHRWEFAGGLSIAARSST